MKSIESLLLLYVLIRNMSCIAIVTIYDSFLIYEKEISILEIYTTIIGPFKFILYYTFIPEIFLILYFLHNRKILKKKKFRDIMESL
jgi:hypothetical protein